MPYAIETFFDGGSDMAVRGLWAEISAGGICDYMSSSGSRPHISLSVFELDEEDSVVRLLDRFSGTVGRIRIELAEHGRFPQTGITFLSPRETGALSAIQRAIHAELLGLGAKVWPHYTPEAWRPHCTLTMNASAGDADRLEALVGAKTLPSETWIDAIGLVRFRTVVFVSTHALRGPQRMSGPQRTS